MKPLTVERALAEASKAGCTFGSPVLASRGPRPRPTAALDRGFPPCAPL